MAFTLFPCRNECKETVGKVPKAKFDACVNECRAKKKASKKGDASFEQALAMLSQDTSKQQGGGGTNIGLIIGVIVFLIVIAVVVMMMMKKRGTTARA
jgi:tetrahydromethanopterin S-methyltransferase subunit G